jgi:hypothetical protein
VIALPGPNPLTGNLSSRNQQQQRSHKLGY